MSTYGPQLTFDVPSGEDYAKRLREAAGFGEHGQGFRSCHSNRRGSPEPDDELMDAVWATVDNSLGAAQLHGSLDLVSVRYEGNARVEVTVVPGGSE